MTAYPIPNSNGRLFRCAHPIEEPAMPTHQLTFTPGRLPDYAAAIARAGTFDPASALRARDEMLRRPSLDGWTSSPRVFERIIAAHFAQADKADEARAGAAAVRFSIRQPHMVGDQVKAERLDAQDSRRRRAARDFGDDPTVSRLPASNPIIAAGLAALASEEIR